MDDASLRNAYLGVEGLRRFEDQEQPYTIYPYGLMMAYVVDDTRLGWETRLVQELRDGQVYDWRQMDFSGVDRPATRHGLPEGCASSHTDVVHLVLEISSRLKVRAPGSP